MIELQLKDAKIAFDLKFRKVIRHSLNTIICFNFLELGIGPIVGGIAGTISTISDIYDTRYIHNKINDECDVRLECVENYDK